MHANYVVSCDVATNTGRKGTRQGNYRRIKQKQFFLNYFQFLLTKTSPKLSITDIKATINMNFSTKL